MAATNYTPISLYYSTTASAVPVNTNLVNGELAINLTDGKLYYKNNGGTVTLLASTAGASGDVVGPASATDNALARFDATTGKLIQNSVGILSDAGVLTGLTGITSSGSITFSSLTSGRVTYAGASGLLQDSANLLFNGTTLTANTLNLTNALGTTYGGTGLTSFTANGVVYASSSSALATGSALTFDGTSLGLGAATPIAVSGYSVIRINGSTGGILELTSGNTRVLQIQSDGASAGAQITTVNNGSNPPLIFGVNSSEQMRLTSTGLGIGTSSPGTKLEVAGAAPTIKITANNATQASLQLTQQGVGNWLKYFRVSDSAFVEQFGGTDLLSLSTSGNLGLGVTPSAWGSGYRAIGINAQGYNLYSITASSTGGLTSNSFNNGTNWIYVNSQASGRYEMVGATHSWYTAPSGTAGNAITFTQAMTLDASGYLAVGSTVTSARLKAALTSASTASITTVSSFGAGGVLSLGGVTTNNEGVYLGTGDAQTGVSSGIASGIGFLREASGWNSALAFYTNNTTDGVTTNRITERARIDSSGNLGLGVTPSVGYGKEFSISADVTSGVGGLGVRNLAANNNITYLSNNAKNTGAFTDSYWTSTVATSYQQDNGGHKWLIAPSGTAGNAITFTQAMTLDASGNLSIGTTSPTAKVTTQGSPTVGALVASIPNDPNGQSTAIFTVGANTAGGVYGGGGYGLKIFDKTSNSGSSQTGYGLYISAPYDGTNATGATYALTKYGIYVDDIYSFYGINNATANANWGLYVKGGANNYIAGNLLVGTTNLPSASYGGAAFVIASSGRAVLRLGTTTTGSIGLAEFYNPNGAVGEIIVNGTATSYNTSSDYRLKNTITPMTGALAKVALLKPCTYKWNTDGSDGEGFIAHELAEVVPQCVSGEKDAVNEDGSIKPQGIDTSFLVATLTAAIQEQQAIIQSLTDRIAQLENKL
jgi:hypothetical protein